MEEGVEGEVGAEAVVVAGAVMGAMRAVQP